MWAGIRAGIGFLAAVQIVVGIWALFFPARFFALAVVGMGMAYNEHLMRDYGAMTPFHHGQHLIALIDSLDQLTHDTLASVLFAAIPSWITDHLKTTAARSPRAV